ncbi:replication restart DNA helicase PriA [Tangfeifania diversioriginum]|uniref:Replication restart protein PriA n=1 Tax=Tangfeifania diversioriginum TaxID=1168035 RepID=A0A1M6L286_9BACT|nr:primosomal protein N' [Tangfeifania diversioriginum]SHJ65405.1 replication restart DNA helicase PriA [Tangfeifania diversioriginum]
MPKMFAQVILPLSLHDAYTYEVPLNMQPAIQPGQRVVVQFGPKKFYAALVVSVSDEKPEGFQAKEIVQLLDESPVVLPQNLGLWRWMASYYCCSLGDIFRAALPPGLKLESKSKIFLTGNDDEQQVSEKEQLIINQLQDISTVEILQKKLGSRFSYPALQKLLNNNVVQVEEKISSKYKPKTEIFVKLHPEVGTEKQLHEKITSLERAKKQKALLLHFSEKTNAFGEKSQKEISKKELFKGTDFNSAHLNELHKKKILKKFEQPVSRILESEQKQVDINLLNKFQEIALAEVKSIFSKKDVALIHGITASGKTEIYIHLIDEALKSGEQVLYLVPEIALTTQIVQRLKNVFGPKVGIYHSRLNNQERVEIWEKVLQFRQNRDKGYQVILGARSSLFMPFSNLGLVIVDEEHENSFKQFDPAPRYNARDMAVVLGIQNKAKVLLGSATPSFESYFNAKTGKYGLVNLDKRHSNIELPEVMIIDLKRVWKRKQMHSVLSHELFELMNTAISKGEQVILFQNRRGYSPYVQCFNCGWIPKCQNCDVSLTYHKYKKRLNCHYCGFSQPVSNECPECGSPDIKTRGFGTEKIEDELKPLFPGARIDRMDLDTTRSKNAFSRIVHNLESRKTDILIGTQMVTKGLDFEHVSVVGILNADNLINFPDFRAHERAYQLISQVSGRAGRKHNRGKVIVQTSQPEHPLIEIIRKQDYQEAFQSQMEERKLFKYPPFYRLIKLVVKHKNPENVNRFANQLATNLRHNSSLIVLGPEFPLVSRIQLWYQKEIWLKVSRKFSPGEVKNFIINNIDTVKHLKDNSSCVVNIDVDPG